jgi:transcriptional regulator with XRE-family HTH domain
LPNTPRERLGRKLRDLRIRAGLSGDALATRAGMSQSKVSRVERGQSLPNIVEVRVWARATAATRAELAEVAALLDQVATTATSWRILRQLGLAQKQFEIAELERQTLHVQTFQPTMIPGLLQTADYARRMFEMRMVEMAYEPGDVARAVAARLERQTVLYDTSKRFDFLLTDGALRWADQAQRDRLRSVATMPNVTIAVTGAPFPYLHPFVIWHLADERLVTVETYSAELQVRDEADLARYQEVWQRLSQATRPWDG